MHDTVKTCPSHNIANHNSLLPCYCTEWKKCSEETQTLHAGCSKAEPKIFARRRPPSLGARDGQNLISWRWSLPLATNPVWWGSMHAVSSYRGSGPTQWHRQDQLQYTAPQLARRDSVSLGQMLRMSIGVTDALCSLSAIAELVKSFTVMLLHKTYLLLDVCELSEMGVLYYVTL